MANAARNFDLSKLQELLVALGDNAPLVLGVVTRFVEILKGKPAAAQQTGGQQAKDPAQLESKVDGQVNSLADAVHQHLHGG